METGEFIFDISYEVDEVVDLLMALAGEDRLLFAVRDYEKNDIEGELGYKIDEAIVATSDESLTYDLLNIKNCFKWFEPRTIEEVRAVIKTDIFFYMGCVLQAGKALEEAHYAFNMIENLTVGDELDSALFIGCRSPESLWTFLDGLEGYTKVYPEERDYPLWLSLDSEYVAIWS